MSRLNSIESETAPVPAGNSAESAQCCNGAPCEPGPAATASDVNQKPEAPQSEADAHERSRLDRVEEIMDQVGKKVGSVASQVGVHLFRLIALGRETAEDCWAEAQSIRRGEPQHEEDKPPTSSNEQGS
jgi:hypothetical protein